jgi:DNA-binding NarL/FixJ family response regulator
MGLLECWTTEAAVGADLVGAAGGVGLGGPEIVEDRVRVVIAEDSVLLREGLTRLLTDRGHEVVAGVGDGDALVKTITELNEQGELPDVVVADVRMPPTHTDEGVRAAVQLRKAHPGLGVLVLSQYVEERYATELLAVPAMAWAIC